MAKWDWYQTTVLVSCPEHSGLVSHLLKCYPFTDFVPAKNLNGYHFGGAIRRGDKTLVHLCWGGQPGVNCKATSDDSESLALALKSFGHSHAPTRLDACEDWYEQGLFDVLSSKMIEYAKDKNLAINFQGDWVRGKGRTLYVGSSTSSVRLVLYEKTDERRSAGFQDAPEHWVRMEARARPKRAHRESASFWEPVNVFECGWLPGFLSDLGYWQDLQHRSIGTVWKCSDAERSRAALLRQYGAIMKAWSDELGGWENLGGEIQARMQETIKEQ